jgi:hypothetical protein
MTMKEAIELLTGQRGSGRDAAVTWDELIRVGAATEQQMKDEHG